MSSACVGADAVIDRDRRLYRCSGRHLLLLAQHPVHRGPTDPQPDGDFRGPDALLFEQDDLRRLSPRCRHTALVAAFTLGLGDARLWRSRDG